MEYLINAGVLRLPASGAEKMSRQLLFINYTNSAINFDDLVSILQKKSRSVKRINARNFPPSD
jgi:hypothetical protein